MSDQEDGRKCVLLCDDEYHILRAAEFKFRRAGFDVLCASDGVEACERIDERIPDAIVTDCQMPRMNGLELIERLHADPRTRDVPVLMLTAKGYELSVRSLREQFNVVDVVAKPFSPRELLKRVEKLVSGEALTAETSK